MTPSPRLLLIAALGLPVAALPVLVHPLAWTAVAALWGALAIGVLFDLVVLLRSAPRATIAAPAAIGVGDTAEVAVTFVLGGAMPLTATLRPEVDAPLAPSEDVTVRLPAGESVASVQIEAPRRGTGAVRALWLRLSGPLGLVHRIERMANEGGAVAVIPNARRVRELTLAHFGAQPLSGGLKVERRAGDGGEFDAMSAYVHGMDVRKVDWKSSARHHDLRVRRYRLERNQRLVVCVDTGRTMGDPIDGVERLDHAIHAAMVLGQTALRAGDLVGLHAYGAEPERWVAPAAGIRHAARITEACASLSSSPVETNHVRGLHALLTKLRRRSLVVMLTDFADSTTAELMVEHLGHLVRRHLILFVALDDPILEEPLSRRPETPHDLAAASVAAGLRQDRQRVLRRLSRMGVDVIHGPPGQATLSLLARYVDVKRRGAIG